MGNLYRRFDIFLDRIDSMISEFGPLQKEARMTPVSKTMKVGTGICTVVGLTTLVGMTIFSGGLGAPFLIGAGAALTGGTATHATLFVLWAKLANDLIEKVQVLVDKFEVELTSMEPVIDCIASVFEDSANDDQTERMRKRQDRAALEAARKNITGYMKLAKNVKDNKIAQTDFSKAHKRISEEIKAMMKTVSDEPKQILSAVTKLLDVCFEVRYLILGKDVTVDNVKEIVDKLKTIRREYNEILTILKKFDERN